ncbi:MAG TPA: hypothetical protein GX516_02195 [Thermoanaerobacter sp.]|nr:hypothetical protein [Thermoanaerobacter sp.]
MLKKKVISAGLYISDNTAYIAYAKNDLIAKEKTAVEEAEKKLKRVYDVATCISDPSIIYKNVILPQNLKKKELLEAVRLQFIELNNLQDYQIFYVKTDYTVEDGVNVICIAVPAKVINNFAEKHKDKFTALDLCVFALWRGATYNRDSPDKPVVVTAQDKKTVYIAAGRKTIEFVREFPLDSSADFEKLRSVEYYKSAFVAEDVDMIELNEEEMGYTLAIGCMLMPSDTTSINLLPGEYRKVRPTEMKKPRLHEIVAVTSVLLIGMTIAPYIYVYRLNMLAQNYQANLIRLEMSSRKVQEIQQEIKRYQEQINAVQSFKTQSYVMMLNSIRYALPKDCEIKSLEFKVTSTTAQNVNQPDIKQNSKLQSNSTGINNQEANNASQTSSNRVQSNNNPQNSSQNDTTEEINPLSNPDTVVIEVRSKSIQSIGLFVDNLSRLPFIKDVTVGRIEYNMSVYNFTITASISPL